MKKYAIYNAHTGENILFDTQDEALQEFWKNVVSFALTHFGGTAYMVVEKNEDGSETWFNDNNEQITKPKSASEIKNILKNMKPIKNKTPVETLP